MKPQWSISNMFELRDMLLLAISTEWNTWISDEHVMLYIAEGAAEVRGAGLGPVNLREGGLIVIPAGAGQLTVAPVTEPLAAYCLRFAAAHVTKDWAVEQAEPPFEGDLHTDLASVIRHRLETLHQLWHNRDEATIRLQIGWLELWEEIAKAASAGNEDFDSRLRLVIEHMDRHYNEPFQVERTARYSGVTPSLFYQRFKEYTSLSPLQYLTKIRMEQARRLLVENKLGTREVAGAVGYADIYYFNKTFKKMIGIPPTRYQKSFTRKIAVLGPTVYDNLLALGVPRSSLIPFWNPEEQKRNYRPFEATGTELQWLQRLKPDLIIGTHKADPFYDKLAQIAPVQLIPFKPYSWREHLRNLADILQAGQVAEHWLYYYDRKVEAARERIHRRLGEQTVLAAMISDVGVRVCGTDRRKLGRLLYQDLRLNAPEAARRFTFEDIRDVAELNDFKADHILLFYDLDAQRRDDVRLRGQVHHAAVDPWFRYSALGHERSIEQALLYFAEEAPV